MFNKFIASAVIGALIPPPRIHLTRFFRHYGSGGRQRLSGVGCLAPHAKIRSQIIPQKPLPPALTLSCDPPRTAPPSPLSVAHCRIASAHHCRTPDPRRPPGRPISPLKFGATLLKNPHETREMKQILCKISPQDMVYSSYPSVEIAKKYSTAESGKFVNGILDKLKSERPNNS